MGLPRYYLATNSQFTSPITGRVRHGFGVCTRCPRSSAMASLSMATLLPLTVPKQPSVSLTKAACQQIVLRPGMNYDGAQKLWADTRSWWNGDGKIAGSCLSDGNAFKERDGKKQVDEMRAQKGANNSARRWCWHDRQGIDFRLQEVRTKERLGQVSNEDYSSIFGASLYVRTEGLKRLFLYLSWRESRPES